MEQQVIFLNKMKEDKSNSKNDIDNLEKIIDDLKKVHTPEKKFQRVNGYLILFDIVDSTKRKMKYVQVGNHWTEHLQNFYTNFTSFSDNLINDIKNKLFLKDSSVIKVIGDMGFLFLPFKSYDVVTENKEAIPAISKLILEKVFEFIKGQGPIPELRLKTIISYICDVYIVDLYVNDTNKQKDIVGAGIDFSFRLEKYANSSCIVLNKYFYNSITEYLDLNEDGKLKKEKFDKAFKNSILKDNTYIYKSKKIVKGWTQSQEFYFLTNAQMIKSAFENSQSSQYENSLSVDLFAKYIQYTQKK